MKKDVLYVFLIGAIIFSNFVSWYNYYRAERAEELLEWYVTNIE